MRVVAPRISTSSRVLGIDPGTRRLGWGVVERRGAKLTGIAAGVLALDVDDALASRLREVHESLHALIDAHAPDALAVEDIFYAKFPSAAIKLGHVRGVVLLVAAERALTLGEYAPALVKRTVAGRGAASKDQVAKLVQASLKLRTAPPSDAADALAIAITHHANLLGFA